MIHKLPKISLDVNSQSRENIEVISEYYSLPALVGVSKQSITAGRNKVNLFNLSCSCKDYRASVSVYARRDIRRVCKHIYSKLFSEVEDKLDDLSKLILHNQFWFGQTNVKKIFFYNMELYVGLHRNSKIISVFLKKEIWDKYVFDIVLKDWINLNKPFDDNQLQNELIKFIIMLDHQIKFE
jgi:hypothetical protein